MKARVDLNSLLTAGNLVMALLIGSALLSFEPVEYVDRGTLGLGLLLCAQTQIALIVERRRRDPFVQLLAFSMILYFELRIFTLTKFPFSTVFDRFGFVPADANFALTFMLIANLFLYAGLSAVRMRLPAHVETSGRKASSPSAVLALLLLCIVLTYVLGASSGGGAAPRAVGTLVVVVAPLVVVTMSLVYFLLFRGTLSRTFVVLLGGLIVLEIVAHTIWGSRSAIVGFVQIFLLVSFAVLGTVTFSRRLVFLGTLFMPLIAVLLVASFALSTAARVAKDSGTSFNVADSLSFASAAGESAVSSTAGQKLIGLVLARAGFFDFSAEVIGHRDRYQSVINLPAYGRSIVDNIATPGFDLFDQPKISNAIPFVYRDWGAPSKRAVAELPGYQSEQIGIYGEYYVLFGYASLPLFFLTGLLLKWAYSRAWSRNPFLHAMMRVIVLSVFVRTLDSFGFDWTLGEVLPVAVATMVYAVLFASRAAGEQAPANNDQVLLKSQPS